MGPGSKSLGVRGCPLSPGPTHGGIGAAHKSQKRLGGSTGLSCDPWNNSRRYWRVRLTPEATQREYWGIFWPHKQDRRPMLAGMYIA